MGGGLRPLVSPAAEPKSREGTSDASSRMGRDRQTIIAECGHEQMKTDRILMAWRGKLEKEPTLLQPHKSTNHPRGQKRSNNPNDDGALDGGEDRRVQEGRATVK